ncbi:fibronectin type III domain-containing protein [Nonomuraea lactucae]|uniref:fibronectin type III domain-containing protein n=1 Tax=Nonomuraea lactucae TaxID=2249762 RepID=UPI0019627FD0|nr:fibronectin type III domain-containing protein [Nonomuraea lactucae]
MRAVPAVGALVMGLLAGACSAPQHRPAAPSAAPEGRASPRLSATLDSPTDITLRWRGGEPGAAGHVVEFATDPSGPYTILAFLPSGQTTFTHPDLIPRTRFTYRVRRTKGRPRARWT